MNTLTVREKKKCYGVHEILLRSEKELNIDNPVGFPFSFSITIRRCEARSVFSQTPNVNRLKSFRMKEGTYSYRTGQLYT